MKTFILVALIINSQGNADLVEVTAKKHKTLLSCYAEKAHYQDVSNRLVFQCREGKT